LALNQYEVDYNLEVKFKVNRLLSNRRRRPLDPVADAVLPFVDLDFDSLVDGQLGLFGVAD